MNVKTLKSRTGISPILATLLLIVIAVAAIVVTYAWIMTYMSSAGHSAGVIIQVENVRFYGEPSNAQNRTDVTVRNTGTSDTNIVRIYMGTSQANLVEVTAYSNIGSGKHLPAKSAVTITITWPNPVGNTWNMQQTYYFKVISDTGQEAPYSKSPSS
ncbi:MAG: archaellin/type IV pilin N-terminal domain-containing protein [Candidatus Bathyarchaeia archaeon]